jgi:hypothetical protein
MPVQLVISTLPITAWQLGVSWIPDSLFAARPVVFDVVRGRSARIIRCLSEVKVDFGSFLIAVVSPEAHSLVDTRSLSWLQDCIWPNNVY